MAMPGQHPFSRFTTSNLWTTLGLEDINSSWCACFNPTYQPTTQSVDRASSSSKAVPRAHRKGIPLRTENPRYTEDSPSESSIESVSFRNSSQTQQPLSPSTTQQPSTAQDTPQELSGSQTNISAQELSGLDFSGAHNSDCEEDSSDRVPGYFRYLEFELDVVRDGRADRLGMDVLHGHIPGLLRILSISEGDAIDRANKKSFSQDPPGPTLEVGDFILQVNDTTESIPNMVSELHKSSSLHIAAVRILPEESLSDVRQDRQRSLDSEESALMTISYNTYLAKKAEELNSESGKMSMDELPMEQILKPSEGSRSCVEASTKETQTNGLLDVSAEQHFATTLPRYSRSDSSASLTKETQTNGLFVDVPLVQELAKLASMANGSGPEAIYSQEFQTHGIAVDAIIGKDAKIENVVKAGQNHDRIEIQHPSRVEEMSANSTFPDAAALQKNSMMSTVPLGSSGNAAWRDGASYLNLLGCMQGLGRLRELPVKSHTRSGVAESVNDALSAHASFAQASSSQPSQIENSRAEVSVQVAEARDKAEVAVQVEDVPDARLNREAVSMSSSDESTSLFTVCAITCVKEEIAPASETPKLDDRALHGVISMSNVPIASLQAKRPEGQKLSPTSRLPSVFSDKGVEEVRKSRKLTPPRKEEVVKTSTCVRPPPVLTKTGQKPSPHSRSPSAFSDKGIEATVKEPLPPKHHSRDAESVSFEAVSVPMVALSKPTLQWAFEDRQAEVRNNSPPPSSTSQRPDHAPRSPAVSMRHPSRDGMPPRSPPMPSKDIVGIVSRVVGSCSLSPKDVRKRDPWFKDQRSEGDFGSFKRDSKEAKDQSDTGAASGHKERNAEEVSDLPDGTVSFSTAKFGDWIGDSPDTDKTIDTEVSPLHSAVTEPLPGKSLLAGCTPVFDAPTNAGVSVNALHGTRDRLDKSDGKQNAAQQKGAFSSLLRSGEPAAQAGVVADELPDALKKAFEKAWDVVHAPLRFDQSGPRLGRAPTRANDKELPTARTPTPTRSPRSGTSTPRRSLSSKRTNSEQVVFRAEDAVGAEEVQKAMDEAYTAMVGSQQSRHRAASIRSSEIFPGPPAVSSKPQSFRMKAPEPLAPGIDVGDAREPLTRETLTRDPFPPQGVGDSAEFSFGRSRLLSSSRKSLSKRTHSPEVVFKVEDFLDAEESEYAEEAEFARICDRWSQHAHPSSSSSCKLQDALQDVPTSFGRSMSMPAMSGNENRSKSLLSPRLVTSPFCHERDGHQRSAFRVEDVVGEAESLAAIDTEFDAILNRWSRHTFRLSSASSPACSQVQKMFICGADGGEYHSPKRRARSCPLLKRADSFGRPIEPHGSHHCSWVDELIPSAQPLVDVVEFEASPVQRQPPSMQTKYRRRYDSND
mmetsp:Transcript_71714/g.112168  ORF Transcript_71714/g.112168 Transcript_71714/m.112168 type:complete len:1377 (+) Transcript_71714:38-4168(+)